MESKDSYAASLAVAKHKTNRAIEHLLGMVTGMVADGQLHDLEIKMLSTWLASYPEVTTEFPVSVIARKISEVLADGIITADERSYLLVVLLGLASTDFSVTGSATPEVITLPIEDNVEINFSDALVCFTGEFLYGTRAACERLVLKLGARCAGNVSKKVNILVIGTKVSVDWAHTSFGRKIQQAMELREAGHPMKIISERRWLQFAE